MDEDDEEQLLQALRPLVPRAAAAVRDGRSLERAVDLLDVGAAARWRLVVSALTPAQLTGEVLLGIVRRAPPEVVEAACRRPDLSAEAAARVATVLPIDVRALDDGWDERAVRAVLGLAAGGRLGGAWAEQLVQLAEQWSAKPPQTSRTARLRVLRRVLPAIPDLPVSVLRRLVRLRPPLALGEMLGAPGDLTSSAPGRTTVLDHPAADGTVWQAALDAGSALQPPGPAAGGAGAPAPAWYGAERVAFWERLAGAPALSREPLWWDRLRAATSSYATLRPHALVRLLTQAAMDPGTVERVLGLVRDEGTLEAEGIAAIAPAAWDRMPPGFWAARLAHGPRDVRLAVVARLGTARATAGTPEAAGPGSAGRDPKTGGRR